MLCDPIDHGGSSFPVASPPIFVFWGPFQNRELARSHAAPQGTKPLELEHANFKKCIRKLPLLTLSRANGPMLMPGHEDSGGHGEDDCDDDDGDGCGGDGGASGSGAARHIRSCCGAVQGRGCSTALTPPSVADAALARPRARIQLSVARLVSATDSPEEYRSLAWQQACLPTDMGGLGVLCSQERHHAIYQARALAAFPTLRYAMPEYTEATLTNGAARSPRRPPLQPQHRQGVLQGRQGTLPRRARQ